MTRFLASVRNLEEAATILAGGADIIDIKEPRHGALGAVSLPLTREIVQFVDKRTTTSATIGDLPMQVNVISSAVDRLCATGVDIVKIGVFADAVPSGVLTLLRQFAENGVRIVLVFFADRNPHAPEFASLADAGMYGVMLDTSEKTGGSLRTILEGSTLQHFIQQARAHGLLTGLAGSLATGDIAPLLELHPDYLGFRGALCDQRQRNGSIDSWSVHNIRTMITPGLTISGQDNLAFTFTSSPSSGRKIKSLPP